MLVPKYADFVPVEGQDEGEEEPASIVVSCNYSLVKILLALGQAIFAAVTLYNTRGDQIVQYGYAAFGLTVAPYAVMSILNLIGNCFCPEYPTAYLVESSVMNEARARGASIYGVVGKLAEIKSDEIELTSSVNTAKWIQSVRFEHRQEDEHELHGTLRFLAESSEEVTLLPNSQLVKSAEIERRSQNGDNECTIPLYPDDFLTTRDPERMKHGMFHHDHILLIPSAPIIKEVAAQGEQRPSLLITKFNTESGVILTQPVVNRSKWQPALAFGQRLFLPLVVCSIPIAIIGGLTHFQPGSSTVPQRAWIMVWLCFGTYCGYLIGLIIRTGFVAKFSRSDWFAVPSFILTICIYGTPAFGTFVIVGQMLMQYGICTRVTPV
jgi:hypothetical protein